MNEKVHHDGWYYIFLLGVWIVTAAMFVVIGYSIYLMLLLAIEVLS